PRKRASAAGEAWGYRSGDSGLSALSLSSRALSDGGFLLRSAALRRHQSCVLQQTQFHAGSGAEPLPLFALHLPSLRGATLPIAWGGGGAAGCRTCYGQRRESVGVRDAPCLKSVDGSGVDWLWPVRYRDVAGTGLEVVGP